MAHRALIADDSPRPTRTAVHKNRPPPIANPGFQRARLQRLSSGPTLARKLPVSVASRTSSARPRMTKATPTTARSTPAARQSVRRDPAASHHDQRNPDEKEGTDTEQPEHHETRRASLCQLTGRRGKTGCPAYRPEQVYGCERWRTMPPRPRPGRSTPADAARSSTDQERRSQPLGDQVALDIEGMRRRGCLLILGWLVLHAATVDGAMSDQGRRRDRLAAGARWRSSLQATRR